MSKSHSPDPTSHRDHPSSQPPDQTTQRPWRTEGLPPSNGDGDKPDRFRWVRALAVALLGYWLVFGVLSWEDDSSGGVPLSYTEFTDQV